MITSRFQPFCLLILFVLVFFPVAGCGSSHPTACTSSSPAPCLSPMTPTPGFSTQDYDQFFERYYLLVIHQHYEQAYAMLSLDLQQHETFAAFRNNAQYVLYQGCWQLVKIAVSQADSAARSWIIGAELAYSSSCLLKQILNFYWLMYLQVQYGNLYVIQLRLYPTGTQSSSSSTLRGQQIYELSNQLKVIS